MEQTSDKAAGIPWKSGCIGGTAFQPPSLLLPSTQLLALFRRCSDFGVLGGACTLHDVVRTRLVRRLDGGMRCLVIA
jgi:hypothetical protein